MMSRILTVLCTFVLARKFRSHLVTVGDRVFGYDDYKNSTCLEPALFEFTDLHLSELSTIIDLPSPLCFATLAALSDSLLVLIGGVYLDNSSNDDTFVYDIVQNTWTKGLNTTPLVSPRFQKDPHVCVNGQIYVSGGVSVHKDIVDTWILDISTQIIQGRAATNSYRWKRIGEITAAHAAGETLFLDCRDQRVLELYVECGIYFIDTAHFEKLTYKAYDRCLGDHAVIFYAAKKIYAFDDVRYVHRQKALWLSVLDKVQETLYWNPVERNQLLLPEEFAVAPVDANRVMLLARVSIPNFDKNHVIRYYEIDKDSYSSDSCYDASEYSGSVCRCSSMRQGVFCEYASAITDKIRICSGNGELDVNNECHCFNGFSGFYCQYGELKCHCQKDFSGLYHGRCDYNGDCICDTGYDGIDCLERTKQVITCCEAGLIADENGVCKCSSGRFGSRCQVTVNYVRIIQNELLGLLLTNPKLSSSKAHDLLRFVNASNDFTRFSKLFVEDSSCGQLQFNDNIVSALGIRIVMRSNNANDLRIMYSGMTLKDQLGYDYAELAEKQRRSEENSVPQQSELQREPKEEETSNSESDADSKPAPVDSPELVESLEKVPSHNNIRSDTVIEPPAAIIERSQPEGLKKTELPQKVFVSYNRNSQLVRFGLLASPALGLFIFILA